MNNTSDHNNENENTRTPAGSNMKKHSKKIIALAMAGILAAGAGGTALYNSMNRQEAFSSDEITDDLADENTGNTAGEVTEIEAESAGSASVSGEDSSGTVIADGTLEAAEEEEIMIPTGIVIDEVLVESGDTVTEGQALATVDVTSVETAISEVEAAIDAIDEQLAGLEEEDETSDADETSDEEGTSDEDEISEEELLMEHPALMISCYT